MLIFESMFAEINYRVVSDSIIFIVIAIFDAVNLSKFAVFKCNSCILFPRCYTLCANKNRAIFYSTKLAY